MNTIYVNLGRLAIARPPDRLCIIGLGSCVALFLWSPTTRWAGLAHVVLPEGPGGNDSMPCKYATHAVEVLLEALGPVTTSTSWTAKLVGAALLFSHITHPRLQSIGTRTVAVLRERLVRYGIPIIAEDVGGAEGRTLWAYPAVGRIQIRTCRGEYWI